MSIWTLFLIGLVVSSIGFHKFVWFISLGYGFSMAAIGVALTVFAAATPATSPVLFLMAGLMVFYGMRLGLYLLIRERRSKAYNHVMKTQVNDGSGLSLPIRILIWAVCALLYAAEASPVFFRIANGAAADVSTYIGAVLMLSGIVLESAADLQKSAQKKVNPNRFCDKGLFSFVRCPNYLGEVLTWTGVLISGLTALEGPFQWIFALAGYLGIVYVMFGGARRLELRQNRNYGKDPEYQAYVKKTPILLPFIPLYSVANVTWLKG